MSKLIPPKRAQAGVEGMIALGVVFILFLGAYVLSLGQEQSLKVAEAELREKDECLLVGNAIVSIFLLEEGAQLTLNIDHNFTIIPSQQRIESLHSTCTIPLKSVSSSGSPVTSPFTLYPGRIIIMRKEWVAVYNG